MADLKQITVVIPAFDEAESVAGVIAEIRADLGKHGIESEMIVVDDGSTDGTAEAALRGGARVLQHRSNRGYGSALKTGILAARNEVIAITDADGTYPSIYLPRMVELLAEADMVVGARKGTNVRIPVSRKPAKWVLNRLADYMTGQKIPDLNSGLRVFRRSAVLQYMHMLPDQFSFTTTITMAMLCDKYAVRYVPIDYRRRTGKSKIVPWDAGVFTMLILRMAMLFRPLRVFIPVAGACLVYGVVKAFIDLVVVGDRNISATAIMMGMNAMIFMLIGMVADALAVRLGRATSDGALRVQAKELTVSDLTGAAPRKDLAESVPA